MNYCSNETIPLFFSRGTTRFRTNSPCIFDVLNYSHSLATLKPSVKLFFVAVVLCRVNVIVFSIWKTTEKKNKPNHFNNAKLFEIIFGNAMEIFI